MSSFRDKKTPLKGCYHVLRVGNKLKKNIKFPEILSQDDAAQMRQFLFNKAIEYKADPSKRDMISFEISPKTVEPKKVGNRYSGRPNVNRQRYFIATDYISKETVVEQVEKFQKWKAKRVKTTSTSGHNKELSAPAKMSRYIKKKWNDAQYWESNWMTSYNHFKDNEHIIGFARIPNRKGDKESYIAVRPNDIVFNVVEQEYFYFNENTYDTTDDPFAPQAKAKKKSVLEAVA